MAFLFRLRWRGNFRSIGEVEMLTPLEAARYEVVEPLRDGRQLKIRALRPGD
jgi:hypothetical protein